MKKKFFILMFISIFLLGCSSHKMITSSEFSSIVGNRGFNIYNEESTSEEFINITIAKESFYQIEFDEMIDSETAKTYFDKIVDIFNKDKSDNSEIECNDNSSNYQKYVLNTDDYYKVIVRINNTIIYTNSRSSYKYEIKNILDELGY